MLSCRNKNCKNSTTVTLNRNIFNKNFIKMPKISKIRRRKNIENMKEAETIKAFGILPQTAAATPPPPPPAAAVTSSTITTRTSLSSLSSSASAASSASTTYSSTLRWRSFTNCNLFVIGLIFIIATCNDLVDGALRNVNLIIEPPAVRRGQHAILRCMYDLEGAPLYSAKFYRGQLEFYRYTPGEFPNTKVFPFPGIHVDVTSSNATQVLIRNVGFGLSGNFSCEVTADAPLFSTATAVGTMQVVELPDKRPQLFTENTRYEPGDILRANCSTPPSRPKAELKFTINNMMVNTDTQYIRTIDNLIASRISLKLQLQGIHFSSANPSIYGHSVYHTLNSVNGGGLVLRCTATIGELYQEYKEIELGTPQKDPVPARVTLSSGSTVGNFFSFFTSSQARTSQASFSTNKLLILIGCLQATLLGEVIVYFYKILLQIILRYKYISALYYNAGSFRNFSQSTSQRHSRNVLIQLIASVLSLR